MMDPTDSIKTYSKKTEGIRIGKDDGKFTRGSTAYPLASFASDAKRHMETYGMDSVFYFKDHGGIMVNIFEFHNRFTLSQVESQVVKHLKDGVYDTYAMDALDHSGEWLVASLAEELKNKPAPPPVW